MCFLYILPWLHENAFKLALQCSIRIDFDSGCVWHWFGTSAAVPGPLPGYPRRAVFPALCLALVLPDHAGRWGFIGSLWRSVTGRPKVPGTVPRWGENSKKMYDKSETESKPGRFELGKSEKNRRNLKLIQTCDFFILCILYIFLYNVSRRDVNFYFITFNSSFPVVFFLLVISEILLLRLFCRLVSLFLRFADSLLMVPMPTPF